MNGDFESGNAPWYGQKTDLSGGPVAAPELLSHETSDSWNNSAGALRLTVVREQGFDYYNHTSGALCPLSSTVPAGTMVRVQFSAKNVGFGTWLGVSRQWGGGFRNIRIGTTWQRYTVYFRVDIDTDTLVFSTLQHDSNDPQPLIDGTLLLDDVDVEIVAEGDPITQSPGNADPNLVINGSLDSDYKPWYGLKQDGSTWELVPSPELVSRELTDTANGSAGALRLTIAQQAEYVYYSHVSGAACLLADVVPPGSLLRVQFWAKSVSGASWMVVSRLWGNGQRHVQVGPQWQQYEVLFEVPDGTDVLVFNLIEADDPDPLPLADGEVLIDEVDARVLAPPAGAMTWFRADRCSSDSSGILSCEDLSNHGYTAVAASAATSPPVGFSQVGGQPALIYSGEQRLRFGDASLALGSSFSMVAIGQHMNENADVLLLDSAAPAGTGSASLSTNAAHGSLSFQSTPPGGGAGSLALEGLACNGQSTVPFEQGDPFVAVANRTTSGVLLQVNGNSTTMSAPPPWSVSLDGVLGDGASVPGGSSAVSVAEALIYNRALGSDELNQLYAYVQARYGIAKVECASSGSCTVGGACSAGNFSSCSAITTECGVGACARTGTLQCVDSQIVDSCQAGAGASSDASCDGMDSDCDGQIDEDFPSSSTQCGVGACARSGAYACVAGQSQDSCVAGTPATSDATCNNVDDDCDGVRDDDFASGSTSCGQGACQRFGSASCVSGQVVDSCVPGVAAGTDGCNGIDDDCDGDVDEDFVASATTCGSGSCAAAGERSCVNGAIVDTCEISIGTACDDGNVCNGTDACNSAGACEPTAPGSTLCCDAAVVRNPLAETPLDPTVVSAFATQVAPLYQGPLASQTLVTPDAIDPMRVVVVQGRVLDEQGAPLPCVLISVLNAPDYGVTRTRGDGRFSIAVNGGADVTVSAALPGYMSARRTTATRVNQYAYVSDIRLMTYGAPTTVSSSAPSITVVAGDVETDQHGTRQATLLFPAGTSASVQGEAAPRASYAVRIKEVTNLSKVGRDGMLASLPPQSAFTYALSLTVDDAENKAVTFNKPVPVYLENFLGFPVGETVPAGRYDDASAQWVAEESGRIVRVASVDGTGRAELDIDGVEGVDDPSVLGVDDAERVALAARYTVGTALWRVRIPHFSFWDFNWGWGPDPSARRPDVPAPFPPGTSPGSPPCEVPGSIIEFESQVLRENIAIPATPYSLVYSSGRQPGSARELQAPLTGAVLPSKLRDVRLRVRIAGRDLLSSFAPAANLTGTFRWDGFDAAGRAIHGRQPALVSVGWTFPGVYNQTRSFGDAAALAALEGVNTADNQRFEATLWTPETQIELGSTADASALGGWSLDVHHAYDGWAGRISLGDGTEQIADEYAGIVTVAGNGQRQRSADGVTAASAPLNLFPGSGSYGRPASVAVTSDGTIYFTEGNDGWSASLRKISREGTLSTVSGGWSQVGGIALDESRQRLFFVASSGTSAGSVQEVDLRTGDITRYAGTSSFSNDSSDGPALARTLYSPFSLALATDGTLYVTDYFSAPFTTSPGRLLKIRDGVMRTVVSDMNGGANGVAAAPDGTVFFGVPQDRLIKRIDSAGVVTVFAGNGSVSHPPFLDAVQATSIGLNYPGAMTVGPDGLLYFVELNNNLVRRINQDGTVTTVVGSGATGYNGEEQPASRAQLNSISSIAFAPDGSMHLVDIQNQRIRKLRPAVRIFRPNSSELIVASKDAEELYRFNRDGRHLATLDAYTGAVRRVFGYDASSLLTTVTDNAGRVTTIERDGSGTATAIVAPDGQRTDLHIDGASQLQTVQWPDGGTYAFTYQSGRLLASMRDPKGSAEGTPPYTFGYENGRLTSDTAPTGGRQELSVATSSTSWTVSRSSALGHVTQHRVEVKPEVEKRQIVHPDQTVAQSEMRRDGRAVYSVNGSTYDSKVVRPDGSTVYSLSAPDPAYGLGSSYAVDTLTMTPSGLTRRDTATRSASVDSTGTLLSGTHTDAVNGRATVTAYDGATHTFVTTTPGGRSSSYALDAQGRVVRMQRGYDLAIEYAYDSAGRPASVTQGDRIRTNTYAAAGDSRGYLESTTNALDETSYYSRDALGRVLAETAADQSTTAYGWDALGDLTSVTPPGRPAHLQTYDAVGEQLSYMPPITPAVPSPTTTFGYNLDRQLTTMMRPDGVSVGLIYEGAGKLDVVATPSGNYDYDYYGTANCAGCAPGKVSRVTSPSGVILQFTYDGPLPKGTTWGGPVSGTLAFSYDNDFRISSEGVNGSTASFGYDADGLVTCASMTTCSPAGSDALRITWDPYAPRVASLTLGGTNETRTYSAYGELASTRTLHGSTLLYSETLDVAGEERDALGRIVTRTETTPSGTTEWRYEYDLRGRLALVMQDGELYERLTYDANGNRIGRETADETIEATYDAQDRMLSYGPYAYTYTANGEMRTKTDTRTGALTTYTYDARGNLVRVDLPDSTTIEYVIDGLDRRVAKKKNGAVQKRWLYRDQLRIAAELDGSGALVSRFVYASRQGVPDFVVRGGVTYRIVSDHLGSPRVVVNASNANDVTQRISHDAWGQVLQDSSPGWLPFGFAGGLYDPDTGLVRFGARDYDVTTARWTARDPILFGGGQANLYTYVDGDPVNRTDPDGLRLSGGVRIPWGLGGALNEFFGALGDFFGNYGDMRDANTIGADKYFHCKANCQASRRGSVAESTSEGMSDAREWSDENIKGDPRSVCDEDQAANDHGRAGGREDDELCDDVCSPYRPQGLSPIY